MQIPDEELSREAEVKFSTDDGTTWLDHSPAFTEVTVDENGTLTPQRILVRVYSDSMEAPY